MGKDIQSGSGIIIPDESSLEAIFYGLLIVSVFDVIITQVIRKAMMDKFLRSRSGTASEKFEKAAFSLSVVIYSLNLSYTIYGLVLVLLGAEMEIMMLFMAFSLIAYQLFRPRQKYLERLLSRAATK